jgi:putative ABC transport system substrate-binding protein
MRRRDLISLIGGAVATWPLAASAQQSERSRRIGVLMGYPDTDSEGQAGVAAFQNGLQQLGWSSDKMRIDTRWAPPGNTEALHRFAKELVTLQPDLILSHSTPTTAALLQETRSIPIVFAFVSDPLGSSLRHELSAPGRKCHRLYRYGAGDSREVVGAPQAGCTACRPGGYLV